MAPPAASCPDCPFWGASYGSQSYCRACYDFTRRYQRGEYVGCRRVIAVKKDHCRLCWVQAGIAASGRRRITPADFTPRRLPAAVPGGHEPPGRHRAGAPAVSGWTQLQLSAPSESLHFDKRHWAASAITNPALEQARHITVGLAAARGWNARIITETGRALAVVLAGLAARGQPGCARRIHKGRETWLAR